MDHPEIDICTGLCLYDLHFPACRSLKEKRKPLKSVKDRIKTRFNVSVMEAGFSNLWQRSALAVSMVADHEEPIRRAFEDIRALIESQGEILVVDMRKEFY